MSNANEPKAGFGARLRKWFRIRLVADVPEGMAACEFNCRRLECTHGEWETCPRRLSGGAYLKGREDIQRYPPPPPGQVEAPNAEQGELFSDDPARPDRPGR